MADEEETLENVSETEQTQTLMDFHRFDISHYFQDIPKVEIIKAASNGDVQDKDITEDDGFIPKYLIYYYMCSQLKNPTFQNWWVRSCQRSPTLA